MHVMHIIVVFIPIVMHQYIGCYTHYMSIYSMCIYIYMYACTYVYSRHQPGKYAINERLRLVTTRPVAASSLGPLWIYQQECWKTELDILSAPALTADEVQIQLRKLHMLGMQAARRGQTTLIKGLSIVQPRQVGVGTPNLSHRHHGALVILHGDQVASHGDDCQARVPLVLQYEASTKETEESERESEREKERERERERDFEWNPNGLDRAPKAWLLKDQGAQEPRKAAAAPGFGRPATGARVEPPGGEGAALGLESETPKILAPFWVP